MTQLKNKHNIDIVLLVECKDCNPNGDPANKNRPRINSQQHGEITPICIKRKMRNRAQDLGESILNQQRDRTEDGLASVEERLAADQKLTKCLKEKDEHGYLKEALKKYWDVRMFGSVFYALHNLNAKGCVSIQTVQSVDPVTIKDTSISRSHNGVKAEAGTKGSDTLGSVSRVEFGLYVINMTINMAQARRNGVSQEDIDQFISVCQTLFENDESSQRPSGSLRIRQMYVIQKEDAPSIPSWQVFEGVQIQKETETPHRFEDYQVQLQLPEGLRCSTL